MATSNISFPHPVLGNGDDVAIGTVSPNLDFEISDEAIRLNVENLCCGHPDIDGFLNSGDAIWHLRTQCSRTYMRENFSPEGQSWSVHLRGEDYEGIVKVEISVVAKNQVSNYRPKGLHGDYEDEEFVIQPGEVLAIGPIFKFLVDKVYDPLKAPVSSIVRINEGVQEDGPFTLTLDDDLIVIWLSKSDWREYAGIRDRAPTIVHSAIVLPALAEAIKQVDEYNSTLWGGRLKDLLEARNIDPNIPLEAAQEILASPIARTFSEINTTLDRGNF